MTFSFSFGYVEAYRPPKKNSSHGFDDKDGNELVTLIEAVCSQAPARMPPTAILYIPTSYPPFLRPKQDSAVQSRSHSITLACSKPNLTTLPAPTFDIHHPPPTKPQNHASPTPPKPQPSSPLPPIFLHRLRRIPPPRPPLALPLPPPKPPQHPAHTARSPARRAPAPPHTRNLLSTAGLGW